MNLPPGLDGWQLLAGLGLFLLGMHQLEQAIHTFSGRTFNLWMQRITGHPLQSVLFGVVATGILQSSSILGLMVLAFVGAGVLPMRNALGVILGSNIGSTFTGWIVAVVGFSLDLEQAALPLIGFGALAVVSLAEGTRRHAAGRIAWSLGLLLLGIGFMTTAAAEFAQGFDPAVFAGAHPLVFFAIGVVVTLIVRTSAATILMALSAMNAGVLDLPQAAAIAIGADLGTTSTMLLAAITGVSAKKQVALFHLLFNLVTNMLALLLLLPHVETITGWYGISDPLLALPAFHTTFNLLGGLLFFPLLGRIADWLEGRFSTGTARLALFLPAHLPVDLHEALQALENEVRALYRRVLVLNLAILEPTAGERGRFVPEYENCKRLEGEIHAFARHLQALTLGDDEARRLGSLLQAAREAIQAAKDLQDVREDLDDFQHRGNDRLHAFLADFDASIRAVYAQIAALVEQPAGEAAAAALAEGEARLREGQQQYNRQLFLAGDGYGLTGAGPSALLNLGHEVHGSGRALLRGCRSLLLDEWP